MVRYGQVWFWYVRLTFHSVCGAVGQSFPIYFEKPLDLMLGPGCSTSKPFKPVKAQLTGAGPIPCHV